MLRVDEPAPAPQSDVDVEQRADEVEARGPGSTGVPMRAHTLRLSFSYAFAGLAYCFRTQRNLRIHVAAALLAALAGIALRIDPVEWAVLGATITLVMAAEMVNTMVESLVDLVTTQYHPLAKVAKDVAAGIVLLTSAGAVVVGLFIFGPRLLTLLGVM
jgi:diacylglycerol kinase (ATP)